MKTLPKSNLKLLIILLLLSAGLIPVFSIAQDTGKEGLLWKIEGKDLDSPSYLYGTIHMICPDDFFITGATRKALNEADQLVMELDMDNPNLMTRMQQLSVNEGMKNFSSELSDEDLEVVNAYFTKYYGADLSHLGVMKPFALVSMMAIKSIDCPQPASYEKSFMELAREEEKEIFGLETVEFQIGIFDQVDLKEQISWVVEYAKDEAAMKEEFAQILTAYKAQDLNKLYEIMVSSTQFEELEDELLFKRNKNWITKIGEYAAEKPTFFAVGAGHLAGDKGVVNLLREAGYKVTEVKQSKK